MVNSLAKWHSLNLTLLNLMTIKEIVSAFSPTYQAVMAREISSITYDFISNLESGTQIPLQHIHISGYAGLGKTHAVSLIARTMKAYGVSLVEIPPGVSPAVLSKMLVDCIESRDPVIIYADEIHTWGKLSKNILKVFSETGGKLKEITLPVGKEEFTVTVNPFIHWFITSSNESVKDSALVGASGRFLETQFVPYDKEGKEGILRALLPQYGQGISIPEKLIPVLVKNVRPFARAIKSMIQSLRVAAVHGANLETAEGLVTALKDNGYEPGGWSRVHIEILRYVATSPVGRQVQEIAMSACKGRDRDSVRFLLDELLHGNLIVTLPNGRKGHTPDGLALLHEIDGRKGRAPKKPAIPAAPAIA